MRDVRHPNPDVSKSPSGHDVPVISTGADGVGDSVSAECSRVLELPKSFRYQVRFDRIPDYDFHAKGFFGNMARSGIVTLLVDEESEDPLDTAFLEVTEPDDGEVFRISADDFISYVSSEGAMSDPVEKECFLREAFAAYGLELQFRDKSELDEVSVTIVNDGTFESFRPETMVVSEGTEGGFPTVAYFSGGGLSDALQMDLKPEFFAKPEKVTVLHLMMFVLDSFNGEGWELPEDAVLSIMKKPYVREGGVSVPVRLIRPAVLSAIDRSFSLYSAISDEEARIEKFFRKYLVSELAEPID